MTATFLALLLGLTAFGGQDAGLHAVWKDGEIRQAYNPTTKSTELFVAWLPSCARAAPTVTFQATFKGRRAVEPPDSVTVRVDLGIRNDPNVMRAMALSFAIDPGGVIDLSHAARPPVVGAEIVDNLIATLDLVDFIRLLTAKRIALNVFGSPCDVSPLEMDALRAFAKIALPSR